YRMDGPTNLAMVTGVALTQEPLDFERTKQVFAHRLLYFRRFRQRVIETGFPYPVPHWEDDPYFSIEEHFHHIALPEPRDRKALFDLLSDLASTPLDYRRPLWQVHVVDGVGEGSALVLRFHHCIGDGTAMMAVSQVLFDTEPNAPVAREIHALRPPRAGLLDVLARPVARVIDQSVRAISAGANLALHPSQVAELVHMAARSVGVAASALLKPPDPASPLKGPLGLPKRVAWSEPVALPEVKRIGKATNAKVNDVLVATMAGALRHYMRERGVDVDGMTIRAVVPVDLRRPDRAFELGNRFGLVFLDLPIGVAGPLERLQATKRNMDALKQSPEAAVFLGILNLFGRTPKPMEDIAVSIFGSKATLVMTNVAGPRQLLYLAGAPVARMTFWVPHPGDLGMGISILSYNGEVTLGIVADAGLVPDPERIAEKFGEEFDLLRKAVEGMTTTEASKVGVKEDETVSAAASPATCAALTTAGKPCKNKPVVGSPYCRVHQPKSKT
ncbi:MAG: wax ester/triacylglycerol synthase family O-acyltransferase, partial [Caldilinea sp.]|nr:wax ester/triacylglycerol synthase family O-acyltransferase [Caldilinea sp.]MDW8440046.1 wax ester/triacylglycerol synthase family O-acyltransferase [Caldilineaceae bacterium]